MAEWKKFTHELSEEDLLDISILLERGIVLEFSVNYRSFIGGKFSEIYRVDTMHGFLHEQRFWLDEKPIPLPSWGLNKEQLLKNSLNSIKENFPRYKRYFMEKFGVKKNEIHFYR